MKPLVIFCLLLAGAVHAQIAGCTDPQSANYNALATENDGSCVYATASVSPLTSVALPSQLAETSGLINFDNLLLTHNDSNDQNLYAINATTANIVSQYPLSHINQDWEELSQDAAYIYVGDFGNNVNGSRTNLKILRISKASLLSQQPVTEIISFSYADQVSFAPVAANTTDFDCEAFIVTAESIYLFTKQWTTKATTVYKIPKDPGQHVATAIQTFNVQGLVTAATSVESANLVVLAGYDALMRPFLYLLYDFNGDAFFSGNRRKINIPLAFHQIEGISTADGINYHLTNERLVQSPLNIASKLHSVHLGNYLGEYLDAADVGENVQPLIRAYSDELDIHIRTDASVINSDVKIFDSVGRQVLKIRLEDQVTSISRNGLSSGFYYLKIGDRRQAIKILLR